MEHLPDRVLGYGLTHTLQVSSVALLVQMFAFTQLVEHLPESLATDLLIPFRLVM